MRRYNIALACARANNGHFRYGVPITQVQLVTQPQRAHAEGVDCISLGVFSEALYSLPSDVFDEAAKVLSTYAARINALRHDHEDDSMFVTLDDLRAVAQKHPVLMNVANAIECIEAERARDLARALDDPWLDAVKAGHAEAQRMTAQGSAQAAAQPFATATPPKVVSCNKHTDCDAADARARAQGEERGAVHCHDDCCEDCFGS
jgi:hypothetical protein